MGYLYLFLGYAKFSTKKKDGWMNLNINIEIVININSAEPLGSQGELIVYSCFVVVMVVVVNNFKHLF